MPESAEDLYARVVAAVGERGRLPMPPVQEWDIFPWEVVDGELRAKVVPRPTPAEPQRDGAGGLDCFNCRGDGDAVRIWENDRWKVTRLPQPGGMPLVLWLSSREHLDYPDMDDALAGEYGRISVWLTRIMSRLPHVGRVHVCRWGDGSEHLHVWFVARPSRLPGIKGSLALVWDEMLPAAPEDVWLADAAAVAERLATHDGRALT